MSSIDAYFAAEFSFGVMCILFIYFELFRPTLKHSKQVMQLHTDQHF